MQYENIKLEDGFIHWVLPLSDCEAMVAWRQANIQLAEENSELRSTVADLKKQIADYKLGTKEKESLLRMIVGMAVKNYGYDPSAKRNPAPMAIQSELKKQEINLSVDTIRKWLKDGKIFLRNNPQKT